jgi:hypothetical protein
MKSIPLAVLAVSLPALALAQNGLPSSKATADVSTLVKCTMTTQTVNDGAASLPATCVDLYTGAAVATENQWIEIMAKPVKLSNSQSLFVSPSLVSGLYTRTRTKTNTGETSTATAMGAVYLRAVLVPDGGGAPIVAAPLTSCAGGVLGCAELESGNWGVILDSRIQSLTQELSACVVDVTSIPGTSDGTCTFTSTIDLLLQTTSANSFNFVFPKVGQGTYELRVYAAVGSGATVVASGTSGGTAVGAAAFGVGSVLVESVRLVHDFEF